MAERQAGEDDQPRADRPLSPHHRPHRHHHHHPAPSERHDRVRGESPPPVSPISADESPPLFMTSSAQLIAPHSSDVAGSHDDAGPEKKTSRFPAASDDVAESSNDVSGEEKTPRFPADSADDVVGGSSGNEGVSSDVSDGQKRLRSFRKTYSHSSSSEQSRKSTDSCTCGFLEFFANALSAEEYSGPQPEEFQNNGDERNSDLAVPSTSISSVLQRRADTVDATNDGDCIGQPEKEGTDEEEGRPSDRGGARNSCAAGEDGEEEHEAGGSRSRSGSENGEPGARAASPPIMDGWHVLPEILLEDIFSMLTPKQRHQASMVCRPWYEIFYSPRVWETFILFERTLTKRRFNLYKGYQRELCPRKTQLCLKRVGCYFKRIIVTPISDYYNLYEFLRVLSAFLAFHTTFPMPLLSTFRFTFACESRGVNGKAIIGTGGNILSMLKDLVINMKDLHHLALNELLLEPEEVEGLLVAAARSSEDTLRYLELINCSKVPVPMCEVTQFSQLRDLKLSPQHMNDELVLLLGGSPNLQRLHIVQDAYTCSSAPVAHEAWKLFREMAPNKRVFLEVEGNATDPLLLQPHAPVRGVIFRTPYHRLTPDLVTWVLEWYSPTLEYLVQERLPRRHGSRRFSERADESVMRLVRLCPRLHTLVIRERISLATMLLVAREAKGLRCLTLRKNALLKRCEWPRAQGWTEEFHSWLRRHGRDYDLAFQQMPLLLKRAWKPSLDKKFKTYRVHVT